MGLKRIGEILLENGFVDEEKLNLGLSEQVRTKERLGATLIKLGFLSESDLLKALSTQLGIP